MSTLATPEIPGDTVEERMGYVLALSSMFPRCDNAARAILFAYAVVKPMDDALQLVCDATCTTMPTVRKHLDYWARAEES